MKKALRKKRSLTLFLVKRWPTILELHYVRCARENDGEREYLYLDGVQ